MDAGFLAMLIPVLALSIGLVTAIKRPARALAPRRDEADDAEERALAAEVDELRRELADTRTRLDFVERLLEKPREPARLAEAAAPGSTPSA
ncbi:MAG TPA: hypothetical protein VHG51_13150 [Longimicrobiaceae bacterium]|nr:hypothetical protein [Longimicrobiaceae bacterium]